MKILHHHLFFSKDSATSKGRVEIVDIGIGFLRAYTIHIAVKSSIAVSLDNPLSYVTFVFSNSLVGIMGERR